MRRIFLLLACFLLFKTSYAQDKSIQTSGDVMLFAFPILSVGTTLILKDYKGTWQYTKGFLLNQGLTFGLKQIIRKERPNGENFQSFPSQHTSTVFQGASFIQRRYGWKYGVPAYVLASFTGFTRLNADKHDMVDVIAGAIIGIGSTYLFTTPYQQEHMELSFTKDKGNYMLGFRFRF